MCGWAAWKFSKHEEQLYLYLPSDGWKWTKYNIYRRCMMKRRNDIWAVVVISKIRNYIHKKKNPFPWLPSIAISTWHGQLILPKRKQLGDTHTNNNRLRGPVAVTVRRVTSKDISGLPFIVWDRPPPLSHGWLLIGTSGMTEIIWQFKRFKRPFRVLLKTHSTKDDRDSSPNVNWGNVRVWLGFYYVDYREEST